MTSLITLTLAGSDVGPFNIYSNLDGFTTPAVTNISRAALVAGYTATLPEGTTEVLVKSTGPCNRDLYLIISGAPTPATTTTTSTTTLIPPPATSTLTFENYAAGQFTFTLTDALSVPVVINAATVLGSHVSNCGPFEESDDLGGSPITIPAGMNAATGTGTSVMSCFVQSWKRDVSIDISGVGTVINGQTVNIGGTIVTIIINTACINYYAC